MCGAWAWGGTTGVAAAADAAGVAAGLAMVPTGGLERTPMFPVGATLGADPTGDACAGADPMDASSVPLSLPGADPVDSLFPVVFILWTQNYVMLWSLNTCGGNFTKSIVCVE